MNNADAKEWRAQAIDLANKHDILLRALWRVEHLIDDARVMRFREHDQPISAVTVAELRAALIR